MNTLPNEIIQLILYNILDSKDYKRSCLVCKKWWNLLKDNALNVANENVYPKVTYLPFNVALFPSWTDQDIQCITGYLRSGMLHGEQVVNVTGCESSLLEVNWQFGKLHGPYTRWQITIGLYTLCVKRGGIKIIDRKTVGLLFSRRLRHICNYDRGEKHGLELKFNIFGDLRYSCEWNNGKKHGEEIISNGTTSLHSYYDYDTHIGMNYTDSL
jgi:hypothetical protein